MTGGLVGAGRSAVDRVADYVRESSDYDSDHPATSSVGGTGEKLMPKPEDLGKPEDSPGQGPPPDRPGPPPDRPGPPPDRPGPDRPPKPPGHRPVG